MKVAAIIMFVLQALSLYGAASSGQLADILMNLFFLNGVSGFSYSLGYFFPSIIGIILLSVHSSKKAKQKEMEEITADGKTYDQIQHQIPQAVKDFCREHAREPEKLKTYLNSCADSLLIPRAYIPAILKEFTAQPAPQQPAAQPVRPTNNDSLDEILAHCSAIAHDYQQLERYIISCINSGKIDCDTASQIWKAYYSSQK